MASTIVARDGRGTEELSSRGQEIVFVPGSQRRVHLPTGAGVDVMMNVVSGQPALELLTGKRFGLEKDFAVVSGGNSLPVRREDVLHLRADGERVVTFRVMAASPKGVRLAS